MGKIIQPRSLAILLLLFVGALLYPKYIRLNSPDFNVFYTAGSHALHSPEKIYSDSPDRFLYPPPASLFFSPLTLLGSWEFTRFLWYASMLFCLYWIISGSYLKFLTGLILLRYFMINLRYGQINIFILFLILLANYFSKNHKKKLAAFSIAMGSILKIFPFIQITDFITKKQWKAIFVTLAIIVSFLLLPFLFWDWNTVIQLYKEYPQQLTTKGIPLYSHNQSFLVLLLRFFHAEYFILFPGDVGYWKIADVPVPILQYIALAFGLFISVLVWKKAMQRNSYYDSASATGFSILCLSHIVWKPYFIFLFPAILQCLLYGRKKERILLGVYLLIGPFFSPNLFGKLRAITLDGACIHLIAALLILFLWFRLSPDSKK